MEIDEKEKTAPGSSVGADEGQPIQKEDNNSISNSDPKINDPASKTKESMRDKRRKMQSMFDPNSLYTISMTELYQNTYKSRSTIIEGVLYPGTYLLAGAPKIGKSFLVAQLAYHVSTGKELWGHQVRQGTVLYLALEDDHRRLQERMYRMFGTDSSEKLFFATCAKQIGNGLEDQLKKFMQEHSDTKLVILDTLQKIREVGNEKNSYAKDYEIIGKLKQITDESGCCFLLVHHTRKQQAEDKFDMISGTNGLLGSADGAFMLVKERRTDQTATLDVSGRDQKDQRIYLTRNNERLIWELDHVEAEPWVEPPDAVLEAIAALVNENSPVWNGTATELVAALDLDLKPNALAMRLNIRAGKLEDQYHICYTSNRNHAGRNIQLVFTPPQSPPERDGRDSRDDL